MRAYREASKMGSVRAPQEFVDMLRRETGEKNLDCWWDPEWPTEKEHPRGNPFMHGCWVIWMKVWLLQRVDLGGGINVGYYYQAWVDVYHLDGKYDRPMVLGKWVADVMNESDMTKRVARERRKFLDDLRERQILEEEKKSAAFAFDFAKDSFVKRIFQRATEERGGAPITTREERVARERALWEREEARQRRVAARAKMMRLHT